MKAKSIAAALAAVGVVTIVSDLAGAADLGPYRAPAPPPFYDAPAQLGIARWSGFYVGGTLGYATGSTSVDGRSGNFSFEQSGGAGTLFVGHNWQAGNMVFGLETDVGTGNLGRSSRGFGIDTELNVFGSLRGRVGVLMTPQTLLYATGGLAWADYDFKLAGANKVSDTLVGYQLGAGLEYAIARQWTLRAEYLFTDLGSQQIDHGGLLNTYDPSFHTIRAGVAFKF